MTPKTPFIKNLWIAASAAFALSARADVVEKVTYTDHVLPIFRNSCLNCHNPDKKKAGLDLSTYQTALQGSENGKVLASGDPANSQLFKCILQKEDPKMPPKGEKLSDAEVAVIKRWIEGQLLEAAGGKAVAVSGNNIQAAIVSLTRPEGPLPMPKELPLEPVVRTIRTNALTALGASPWAPLVAVGGQEQIILYNTESLEPLGILPFPEGFPTIIKFSRNGQLILTGGGRGGKSGKVAIWDVLTGDRGGTVGNEFDQVLAADLSADHQLVALGGPGKLVKIYSAKDGRLVHSIKKHTDWVTAIAFSPDGKLLASADRNGGLIVWESASGRESVSLAGHKAMITGVAFLTGVLASASEDGTIKLWDVNEGKPMKSWAAHAGGVQSVDFTPDGRLVSCGRDKLAKVWNTVGKQIMASEPFGDIALRAEIAGERVVAGDWNGQIRVWSLPDGKRIGELTANPPSIAERIAVAQNRLAELKAAHDSIEREFANAKIQAEGGTIESAPPAQVAEAAPSGASLATKLKEQIAELTLLREARNAAQPATPEHAEAQAKVQVQKSRIEETKAAVGAAEPAAATNVAARPAPETELIKATAARAGSLANIDAQNRKLLRWKIAQRFMTVHTARQTLAEREARHASLVAAAKEAFSPLEKMQADLAAADKGAAAMPAKIAALTALLAQAQEDEKAAAQTIRAAQKGVAERENALQKLAASAANPAVDAAALAKTLEVQNGEVARLREARGKQAPGTAEYDEANVKVQAKKAEIAATQAAIQAAQSGAAQAETAEIKAVRAEIGQARAALEKRQAEAPAAWNKVAAAGKALADASKEIERAKDLAALLRRQMPAAMKSARLAKAQAEQAAQIAEKEVAAAKVDAEKRRTDYEAFRSVEEKAARAIAFDPEST